MKDSSSGSTETAHTLDPSVAGDQRARELTRWAWLMIPGTALGALAAFVVGSLLMRATGTSEGELLTSSGIAGWISWVAVVALVMCAPLAGVVLAVRARRVGAGHRSTVALVLNAVVVTGIIIVSVGNVFTSP